MSKRIKIVLWGLLVSLTLLAMVAGGFAFREFMDGKLPPHTYIAGVNLSYKTPAEAKNILLKMEGVYKKAPIELSLNNTYVNVFPEELGIDLLTDETVNIVNEADKNFSILDWAKAVIGGESDIDLLVKLDDEKLIKEVRKSLSLSKIEPKPATFYFDETSKLAIKDEQAGLQLNEEKLIKDIKEGAKRLRGKKTGLEVEIKTPLTKKVHLEKEEEGIKEMLNHQLVLNDPIYSDDWYLKMSDHLDWVDFETKELSPLGDFEENNGPTIKVAIKQEKLNGYIDAEISEWLDVPSESINIYTDEEGEVVMEGKGSNGLQVERKTLKLAMEIAIDQRVKEVPIPVVETEPVVTISEDLQELGIKERIAVGHTSYYHSTGNRVHNIKTAAARFSGVLIAPGEEFSFNTRLGAVDGSTGYRRELVIKPEGTIPEYGGGICQVSTTVYRSVLFSGFPVVERNEHSYAVSYYSQVLGHGLDATIYLGGPDLKFTNDTKKHVLMQTYHKGDYELYVSFYGTPPDREIELEGPMLSNYHSPGPTIYKPSNQVGPGETKQVEKAHTGFRAVWYRHITNADGETVTESIETNYKAIPAKILVGPEEGEAPTE